MGSFLYKEDEFIVIDVQLPYIGLLSAGDLRDFITYDDTHYSNIFIVTPDLDSCKTKKQPYTLRPYEPITICSDSSNNLFNHHRMQNNNNDTILKAFNGDYLLNLIMNEPNGHYYSLHTLIVTNTKVDMKISQLICIQLYNRYEEIDLCFKDQNKFLEIYKQCYDKAVADNEWLAEKAKEMQSLVKPEEITSFKKEVYDKMNNMVDHPILLCDSELGYEGKSLHEFIWDQFDECAKQQSCMIIGRLEKIIYVTHIETIGNKQYFIVIDPESGHAGTIQKELLYQFVVCNKMLKDNINILMPLDSDGDKVEGENWYQSTKEGTKVKCLFEDFDVRVTSSVTIKNNQQPPKQEPPKQEPVELVDEFMIQDHFEGKIKLSQKQIDDYTRQFELLDYYRSQTNKKRLARENKDKDPEIVKEPKEEKKEVKLSLEKKISSQGLIKQDIPEVDKQE